MGEAVWKVLGTGAAIGAGILAKKLATAGWKLGTGNEPPVNPEDPEVTWRRRSAGPSSPARSSEWPGCWRPARPRAYYRKSAGHDPKGLNKVS